MQYYGGEGYANQGAGLCDTTYQELYSYSSAGGVIGKQLQLTRNFPTGCNDSGSTPTTVTLAATFAYDNEGRMTGEQYPLSGPNMAFTYDSMGRPLTAEDQNNNSAGAFSAAYNPGGQLLGFSVGQPSGSYSQQAFTYNSMLQITSANGIQYNDSATQNNGKIISQVNMASGEQVNYTYDALNRLATAETSPNSNVTQWGQSFTYDGFGNLTNVNVLAGSAPTYSANYGTANQAGGDCPDANGNLNAVGGPCGNAANDWYDVENRVLSPNYNSPVAGSGGSTDTWYYYGYAPGNKRVWRGSWQETTYNCQIGGENCQYSWSRPTDIVAFYAPSGQKLAEYSLSYSYGSDFDCSPQDPIFSATQTGTYYYFGGRMFKNENGWVYPDRLGSIGKFYPFGTERPSATTNGTEKFTGYFRDAETGNDYADQRYHLPGQGRFMSPDRAASSAANPANPGTWNVYVYVSGDPINRTDPRGTNDDGSDGCGPGFVWDPGSEQCVPCPPVGGGPPPGPPPVEDCVFSLYQKSVTLSKGVFHHTYLSVSCTGQDGFNAVIEADPGPKPKVGSPPTVGNFLNPFRNYYLVGISTLVSPASPSTPTGSNPYSNTDLGDWVDYGSDAINLYNMIMTAVYNYDFNYVQLYTLFPTQGSGTYNSNSFTFTLIQQFLPLLPYTNPTRAPGWGIPVPNL